MIFSIAVILTFFLTCQSSSEFESISKANNEFALKIYKSFHSHGNTFFSPASIFIASGMLYNGARGNTAQEMRKALSYDTAQLSDESLHQKMKDVLELTGKDSENYSLQIANAIVSSSGYPISDAYKEALKNYYKAIAKEVDFGTGKKSAIDEINGWVSEKTKGKIPNLFDDLDDDTVMVLLNAVYFKGSWASRFNKNLTVDDVFFADGKNPTSVRMMRKRDNFLHAEFPEDNFSVLKLPYKGEDLSMVVLLPKEKDGLKELEEILTLQKLEEVMSSVAEREQRVDVSLPKFKLEDKWELVENLKELGMQDVFIEGKADLTGIDETGRMVVSDVVHKAVIEVNEEGSEAAAATGIVAVVRVSRPLYRTFKADHPFLFLIRDERTKMILFMGRVTKI